MGSDAGDLVEDPQPVGNQAILSMTSDESKSGSAPAPPEQVKSIHGFIDVFKHLDPVRGLISSIEPKWNPPQVTVIGPENCGKSSMLNRLLMRPFFPRDRGEFAFTLFYPCVCALKHSVNAAALRIPVLVVG